MTEDLSPQLGGQHAELEDARSMLVRTLRAIADHEPIFVDRTAVSVSDVALAVSMMSNGAFTYEEATQRIRELLGTYAGPRAQHFEIVTGTPHNLREAFVIGVDGRLDYTTDAVYQGGGGAGGSAYVQIVDDRPLLLESGHQSPQPRGWTYRGRLHNVDRPSVREAPPRKTRLLEKATRALKSLASYWLGVD